MRQLTTMLLLLTASWMVGQVNPNSKIDSLKALVRTQHGAKKFKTLCYLSDEYSSSDLEKSLSYGKQALLAAKGIKSDSCLALAYNTIANTFQYKLALDSALSYHRKALKVRVAIKDSLGIADTYNNIGIVYDTKGDFEEALNNYFKALYYYDKKNDIAKQGMTYTNIGIVYKTHLDYPKALAYYRKAYAYYSKAKDAFGITVSSGNLGSILINFKQYKESLKFSEMATKGYRKLGYDRYIPYPLVNIAVVYDSLHQFASAEKYYHQSIAQHIKFENWYEAANGGNGYALCLIKQKKYNESIAVSEKAKANAMKSDAELLINAANENLSKAYAKLGNFEKAYKFSNLYAMGKDSLFVKEKTKAIFELDAKYQTEKKEKLLLKKEIEARQRNLWLLILGFLVLTTIVAALMIYRQQKLRNKQQEQEFRLETAIAKIETQNKLQEQRLSISRDLHDNIGAQLTFIISSVDNLKYAFDLKDSKLNGKLDNISDFTQSTIIELRDTIWAMNSEAISFEDLRMRIMNFIEKAKTAKEGIAFGFDIDEGLSDLSFSSVAGMNIYRTIQEAVNNAVKYANAIRIGVHIYDKGDEIRIEAIDDGLGFNQDTVLNGNGLHNMKKRIRSIGGVFDINSAPGSGTTVSIHIQKALLNTKR
ncbi:sensor histidine kinase [Flavobacterium sp.]|uniref:tetratricopeptide repeat-containing sensor histidine kinase n=1 Tax=Flavobacterium sp. TaxID=239 RepID=UPI002601976E|nr:sensor histidine kinase [Flavobacterium sp.]